MPNASNTARVLDALAEEAAEVGTAEVAAADVTADRAVLAVQGPAARAKLATVWPDAAAVKRFRVVTSTWQAAPATVAGTGYTGEDGVELAVARDGAASLWQALLDHGIEPAGLGARDTLRLEAGLPLHGHELGPGITPLQAGLGWVIGWDKGPFRGRAALEREQAAGVPRRLRGLSVEGRRPPRADQPVRHGGEIVGTVTSGNFAPMLGHGIALAFLDPSIDVGAAVAIDARGSTLAATVVPLPFVG
jgi:aminomethyltransferase